MKLRFVVLVGALLGAILPVGSQVSATFADRVFSSRLASVYLWPSSIWLLATDGHEQEFGSYVAVWISALANVLLYALLATLLWLLLRLIQRATAHSP